MKNIQELTTQRLGQPQVWCIGFYTEGHLAIECSRIRGMRPLHDQMRPSSRPTGGVA
jgi:hypothetical protein